METAGRVDHKTLNRLCFIRSAAWKESNANCKVEIFFNLGLIYVSCQAKFGNARADVWFRTPEHLSPAKCPKSWTQMWTPKLANDKKEKTSSNFLSKGWRDTVKVRVDHGASAWASIRGSINDTTLICFDEAKMPSEKHLVCFSVTLQLFSVKGHTQFSFVQELSTV